jgi:hypothetical protein
MKLYESVICTPKGEAVKQKSMMSKRSVVLAACLLFSALLLGGVVMTKATFAQAAIGGIARGSEDQCSLSTLNGRYVFAIDGVQVMKSDRVPFTVAGLEIFDGHGHLRGVISQSVNGNISRHIRFTGTYTVTQDCFSTETLMVAGATLHFDQFTVSDGSVFSFVETDPGVVTAGYDTRGTGQRVGN